MKKIVSFALAFALLCTCLLAFASCSKKLSGTYELDAVIADLSYEFKGNKVTVTVAGLGSSESIEGEYEITENDDGETVIIFTFASDEEGADDYAGEFSFAEGKEGDVEYIKIGGVRYNKKDK